MISSTEGFETHKQISKGIIIKFLIDCIGLRRLSNLKVVLKVIELKGWVS